MEGGRIVDQRVLADLDGVAHCRDGRRVDDFRILLQLDDPEVFFIVAKIIVFGEGRVADQLHVEPVAPRGHVGDLHGTFLVGEGEMRDGRVALAVQIDRRKGQRFLAPCILHLELDLDVTVPDHFIVHHVHLRVGRARQQDACQKGKESFSHQLFLVFNLIFSACGAPGR